jgi:hypothetical protein
MKIFKSGNTIYLQTNGQSYEGHAINVLVRKFNLDSAEVYLKGFYGWSETRQVNISDLVDQEDNPYTISTFKKWVDLNTGTPIGISADSTVVGATKDGRGFLATTAILGVSPNNVLAFILRNPVDSGMNIIFFNRIFCNNNGSTIQNLEYVAFANPTANLSNSSNGINLLAGGANSNSIFQYQVLPQADLTMGGVEASGEILPNGTSYNRRLDVIIPPGGGVGFTIDGGNRNISTAVRVSAILEFYEESVS